MNFNQNRDFLEFHSLPLDAITAIIDRACQLAKHWADRTMTLDGGILPPSISA
ncbi:hypothetical protein ACVMIX_001218 [Rhizobium leguminosarum]